MRRLKFRTYRYNPCDPESKPHMQTFELAETEGMTLFIALTKIREEQDPSLQFDFSCRSGICGSCGMLINGKPDLACKKLLKDMPAEITLKPLPGFDLIGDLSVDTGSWFRKMSERVGSWIHTDKIFDPSAVEERMDDKKALQIYELDRCIECGCCISACAIAQLHSDFLGATGLVRLARFMADPRDGRTAQDFAPVATAEEGVFGCSGILACHDLCPKGIPIQKTLAYIRRSMAFNLFGVKKDLKKTII